MKKILLLDDEKEVGEVFNTIFEDEINSHDLKIDFFTDPVQCLNYLNNEQIAGQYESIVTDLNMPVINGIEFVKNLRERGISTPVIFLSGYLDYDYKDAMKKYGVRKFVAKPLFSGEIRNLIGPT